MTFQGRNDTSLGPTRGLSDPERMEQEGDVPPDSLALLCDRITLPWRLLWVGSELKYVAGT